MLGFARVTAPAGITISFSISFEIVYVGPYQSEVETSITSISEFETKGLKTYKLI
ncbi:hypothetical protein D3C80_1294870 [compost metagenome]